MDKKSKRRKREEKGKNERQMGTWNPDPCG